PRVLTQLDHLHARLSLLLPELRPPSFTVVSQTAGQTTLHYESERSGLTEFAAGLIEGLANMFAIEVQVSFRGKPQDTQAIIDIRYEV
ncbi:MAG: hypothetical protein ACI85K_003673, partial [Hyphomicrobiaceae bacterium]